MLRVRSHSLVDDHNDNIKEHIEMLIQKSEEMVKEKLQRQQQKEAKIDAVEKMFVEWAGKKGTQINEKLEKSKKIKEDYINKIVKKCKQHQKYLGEKLKSYQIRRKVSLRDAWKKAQLYKQSIEDYQNSKNISKEKPHKVNESNDMTSSQFIHTKNIPFEKNDNSKEYLSAANMNINQSNLYNNVSNNINQSNLYKNISKDNMNISKQYNNTSKDYWMELNQSLRQFRATEVTHFATECPEIKQQNQVQNKLRDTLVRFRQTTIETEQMKIQQLGQRLHKIQQSRAKRLQSLKKKKDKYVKTLQDSRVQKKSKKKNNRSDRLQSQSKMIQKRVHDWSDMNKQKRQQMFQAHIKDGEEYLQSQKNKYIKTILAKQIALSAIQKKLYFQRLNH